VSSPLFSVIIPTYGRPDFLFEAVGSVLAQTVQDFEIVVVDDGGPGPVQVPADPRVRLVRRAENGGPAAARNAGMKAAQGKYLTFLDDDDLYVPDRLALGIEGLRRGPVATCWIRFLHATPGSNRLLEGDTRDIILENFVPHIGAVTVERSIAPTFDERFLAAEDNEWWLRMSQQAPVSTVPRVGYLMRHHRAPRHLITGAARIEGRLLLLRLHRAYFDGHPRAEAFQWKRIGLLARAGGDYRLARTALLRALRLHLNVKGLWHLTSALRPSMLQPTDADQPAIWDR
jgi:glycosyltransferase involved in cell wall biosynthesis